MTGQVLRDPSTGLAVLRNPIQLPSVDRKAEAAFRSLFTRATGQAVIHYMAQVDKVSRWGRKQHRILFVSSLAVYLTDMQGTVTRCIPVGDIVNLVIVRASAAPHVSVALRTVPSQYDVLLRLQPPPDAAEGTTMDAVLREADYLTNVLIVLAQRHFPGGLPDNWVERLHYQCAPGKPSELQLRTDKPRGYKMPHVEIPVLTHAEVARLLQQQRGDLPDLRLASHCMSAPPAPPQRPPSGPPAGRTLGDDPPPLLRPSAVCSAAAYRPAPARDSSAGESSAFSRSWRILPKAAQQPPQQPPGSSADHPPAKKDSATQVTLSPPPPPVATAAAATSPPRSEELSVQRPSSGSGGGGPAPSRPRGSVPGLGAPASPQRPWQQQQLLEQLQQSRRRQPPPREVPSWASAHALPPQRHERPPAGGALAAAAHDAARAQQRTVVAVSPPSPPPAPRRPQSPPAALGESDLALLQPSAEFMLRRAQQQQQQHQQSGAHSHAHGAVSPPAGAPPGAPPPPPGPPPVRDLQEAWPPRGPATTPPLPGAGPLSAHTDLAGLLSDGTGAVATLRSAAAFACPAQKAGRTPSASVDSHVMRLERDVSSLREQLRRVSDDREREIAYLHSVYSPPGRNGNSAAGGLLAPSPGVRLRGGALSPPRPPDPAPAPAAAAAAAPAPPPPQQAEQAAAPVSSGLELLSAEQQQSLAARRAQLAAAQREVQQLTETGGYDPRAPEIVDLLDQLEALAQDIDYEERGYLVQAVCGDVADPDGQGDPGSRSHFDAALAEIMQSSPLTANSPRRAAPAAQAGPADVEVSSGLLGGDGELFLAGDQGRPRPAAPAPSAAAPAAGADAPSDAYSYYYWCYYPYYLQYYQQQEQQGAVGEGTAEGLAQAGAAQYAAYAAAAAASGSGGGPDGRSSGGGSALPSPAASSRRAGGGRASHRSTTPRGPLRGLTTNSRTPPGSAKRRSASSGGRGRASPTAGSGLNQARIM